jgi:hypothetical protein
MNQNSKENKNQPDENIDKTLDLAIENAEIRKELSDTELDEIAGGKIIVGYNPAEWIPESGRPWCVWSGWGSCRWTENQLFKEYQPSL